MDSALTVARQVARSGAFWAMGPGYAARLNPVHGSDVAARMVLLPRL